MDISPHRGLRTTLIGIAVSAVLALVKGVCGILGHSYALVADAIESGADVFTSTMLWIGLKFSSKPADDNHPYGHGKAEALISIGISLALVGAAGIIIKDSIFHILEPHKAPAPFTLIVLVLVIATKEFLYRFVLKTGREINSAAVSADAFHHRSDAITSAAAFIGISIALIGGEGYAVADDYAALFAGGFIIYNAYGIGRPAIGELLDESLEPELSALIKKVSKEVSGADLVEKCHIRKMGPGFHVDIHLWIDGDKSVSEGHEISHLVKDRIQLEEPRVLDVHIHMEPSNRAETKPER